MSVLVPTMQDFAALELRVAQLEQGRPKPPEPAEGVQAKRVADVVELFGVNTFSSLDDGNLWGSWPADYRPASVVAALNYITEGTGFALRLREYHYNGREDMQRDWLRQVIDQLPGTRVAICPGANATVRDIPTMVALAQDPACAIYWAEGLNEPNTNFGSGEVPVEQTKAMQDALWAARDTIPASILGPSIVAGTPHPEGWIRGYCGNQMDAINAAMQEGNGHYYPPGCPDVPGTGYSTSEYIGGLWTAYAQHPIHLTEFHPTLYNSVGLKPDDPAWNGERDAFYTLLTLLRCVKCNAPGCWWYALFDYGSVYRCGLFPRAGTDAPRPAATVLRNLCRIMADDNPMARTFAPGKLDVAVAGDCDWDLYQGSNGTFRLALWRGATELGGTSKPIEVSFGDSGVRVAEFDPIVSAAPVRISEDTGSYLVGLPAGVRILTIDR